MTYFFLLLLVAITRGCNWFGGYMDTPLYPMDVCSTVMDFYNESSEHAISSTLYTCIDQHTMRLEMYDDTDCSGTPYFSEDYRNDDGDTFSYYFNCEANYDSASSMCPYVLMRFFDITNGSTSSACTIDTSRWEEYSVITDTCLVFKGYGLSVSYYVDCDASSVIFESYNDTECDQLIYSDKVKEGCDDPFDLNLYIQIAECEDAVKISTTKAAHTTSTSTKTPGNGGDNSDDSNTMSLIITIISATVAIIIAILIGAVIVRRKREQEVMSMNINNNNKSNLLSSPIAHFERLEDDIDANINNTDPQQQQQSAVPDSDEVVLNSNRL